MQRKMTNTMTMQEQIELSGLEIVSSLSSSSSSSLSQLQWNSTNQWSPLLGGGRELQACVTIMSGSDENDAAGQSLLPLVAECKVIPTPNLSLYGIHPPKDGEMGPA